MLKPYFVTLLGIIFAGLCTSGENVVREIDREFARNQTHFPGKISRLILAGIFTTGEMWFGKNMVKLSRTCHCKPVLVIPSKVSKKYVKI